MNAVEVIVVVGVILFWAAVIRWAVRRAKPAGETGVSSFESCIVGALFIIVALLTRIAQSLHKIANREPNR